jgi:hypothetical protein
LATHPAVAEQLLGALRLAATGEPRAQRVQPRQVLVGGVEVELLPHELDLARSGVGRAEVQRERGDHRVADAEVRVA